MNNELFEQCYSEIKKNSEIDDTTRELWFCLLSKAIEYTEWRARWSIMSMEEKMEKDDSRTSCHNSLITHFNMLSRYLDSIGIIHSWRSNIGDYRKDIGDFGNYIVFREALNNR